MSKHGLSKVATTLVGLMLLATPVVGQSVGEGLFQQKCAGCHGLGSGDRPTGPDLAGVVERRDHQWLRRFIVDPGKMLAAGDPLAVELLARFNNLQMPAMDLNTDQIDSLLAYLAAPVAAATIVQAQPAAEAVGNAERGEQLFTGEAALVNGGAPCLACHGIAGVGLAGGANFGPDLTSSYENYGEEGVAGILESLPFPSMEPIYATRPLTEVEQQDLGAYFAQVSGTPVINDRLLLGEVASGVLVLLGVLLLLGWGRLQNVRRSLVARASNQKGGMR